MDCNKMEELCQDLEGKYNKYCNTQKKKISLLCEHHIYFVS